MLFEAAVERQPSIINTINEIIANDEDPGLVLSDLEMLDAAAAGGAAPPPPDARRQHGGPHAAGAAPRPGAGGPAGGGDWLQRQHTQHAAPLGLGLPGLERQGTLAGLYEIDSEWLEGICSDSEADALLAGDAAAAAELRDASQGISTT